MTDGSPVSTETAAESVILALRQYPQGRAHNPYASM